MSLRDALTDDARRPAIVEDCCTLIDEEVKSKSGLGGMTIKAGYKTVKGVKPGFVRKVVEGLLPEFAEALEPIHAEATAKNAGVKAHMVAEKARVADALLAVTDARAEKTKYKLVKSTYKKLRGSAKKNVEAAVPRLGDLVERYS